MERQPNTAAFFDLDKTILATASSAALTGRFVRVGLATRWGVLRSTFAQLAYQYGHSTAQQTERLSGIMSALTAGWEANLVDSTTRTALEKVIAPQVFAGAASLMAAHKQCGAAVVICTAAAREVAQPIADMLGADHLLATEMEVEDGHYTGQIALFNYGQAKADAMQQLAEEQGFDLSASFAYSDSITDLPMLEAVGHAAVVNPSAALRAHAEERGWATIRFATPGPIRRRRVFSGAAGTGALLVPAAGTWLTLWWLRRRRRQLQTA